MGMVLLFVRGILALVLVFFCWTILLGTGLGFKKYIDRLIVGFAAVQTLFYLVYIPAIVFSWSTRLLVCLSTISITGISILLSYVRYKKTNDRKKLFYLHKPDVRYVKNPFFLGAIMIIAYEMWIYIFKEPYIYGDDTTYVRLITEMVDTNSLYTREWADQIVPLAINEISYKYAFTSYYPFLSVVSILSGIHPLILCKTVIPVIYLPLHYLIIWRIGQFLFDGDKDTSTRVSQMSMFFFVYSILVEFGMISYYTLSRRVTIWIYNGKSVCFCLLLIPLFFYIYVFLSEIDLEKIVVYKSGRYKKFLILLIATACVSSSLMGLVFSTIIMLLWYIIFACRFKNYRVFLSNLWTLVPNMFLALLVLIFVGLLPV